MIIAAYILTAIGCILIFVQDVKKRLIHIGSFVIMLIGVLLNYKFADNNYIHLNVAVNIIFLFFVLIILKVHVLIKAGRKEKFINKYFGVGDVIILCIVALSCSFNNYLLIVISSSIIGLVYGLFLRFKNGPNSTSIPLAGIVSMIYLPAYSYTLYTSTNLFYFNIIPLS